MASFHDTELLIFSRSSCRNINSSAQMSFQPTNRSSLFLGVSGSQTGAGLRQLAIHNLDQAHQDTVTSAIARILDTDIAEITYAQIIDGLPLGEVAFESRGGMPHRDHPINHCHDKLCDGILDSTRGFRSTFYPNILKFDSRNAVYVHPDRENVTYRICRLTSEKRLQLLKFLTAEVPDHSPLPILPNEKNDYRIDPEESPQETGIYKDIWDRSELREDAYDQRLRDVWNKLDYLTHSDKGNAADRALERRNRIFQGRFDGEP
ncbi:hypothetical protein FOMG_12997 [Fusarium oxysporum f. sp. melonis 26406]|uniref:Uncharacterized protein n=1 Tax=Fusarium oxysporum f. sp. melonis 26406 TaxID=1089452 RepID=W9ZIR7_FUSOX|nr:hypothetical protein FOMG_12997 [Fusarium oxysporum f. sp. melonis 26406]